MLFSCVLTLQQASFVSPSRLGDGGLINDVGTREDNYTGCLRMLMSMEMNEQVRGPRDTCRPSPLLMTCSALRVICHDELVPEITRHLVCCKDDIVQQYCTCFEV